MAEKEQSASLLRYVFVLGYSDREEGIRVLGKHLSDYEMIQKVEILPYHTVGSINMKQWEKNIY